MNPAAWLAVLLASVVSGAIHAPARVLSDHHGGIVITSLSNAMGSVGILDPGGRSYTLLDSEIRCPGTELVKGSRVTVARDALGVRWERNGERRVEYVFRAAGNYRVFVSENLETEQSDVVSLQRAVRRSRTTHAAAPPNNGCTFARGR